MRQRRDPASRADRDRSSEFALRTALGASRPRIVAQLFVETLVLALLATGVGLLGIHLIVERVTPGLDLPFWVDLGVTSEVVMEALGLGVASAVLAGVLPALRATGSSPQRTLQEIDLGDDPTAFAPVLRRLLADADPTAILGDVVALDQLPNTAALVQRTASGILVGLSLIAIVLSTAALYALMSFTVARRAREIGVRIALGGRSSRIVASIARRPLRNLMLGVLLGAGFWAVVFTSLNGAGAFQGELGVAVRSWPTVLSITAAIVVTTGLLACLAPILRGLRIRPVEALRVDA